MSELLDDSAIDIPCEVCGHKTQKSVGWIKTNNKFTCVCGADITLDATQFKSEIAKAERSLERVKAELKKLGK